MLYRIGRIMMIVALRYFYRRVYATGLETIAPRGPAIIIANHTASVMDAVLLGILLKRPIHFFTRGDVFAGKITGKILTSLNMIPVHDHEAGRITLASNEKSFLKAEKILLQGGVVLFFPEGNSQVDMKLRPLRKGVFRLAFQAAAGDTSWLNIPIIPIGINYSHPCAYQADVMLHVGTPILLDEYKKEFLSNPPVALLHITKDSYIQLDKQILNITSKDLYKITADCLCIRNNDYHFFTQQWMQGTRRKLEEEKMLCRNIHGLPPEKLVLLQETCNKYFHVLDECLLTDRVFSSQFTMSFYEHIRVVLGFPFFIPGYLLNCLPVIMAKKFADKKVSRIDYYSWVFVTSAAFLYVTWVIVLFFGFLLVWWVYAVCVAALTFASGIFVHYYMEWLNKFIEYKRLKRTENRRPAVIQELKELRARITEIVWQVPSRQS